MPRYEDFREPRTNPGLRVASGLASHVKTVKATAGVVGAVLAMAGSYTAWILSEARAQGKDAGSAISEVKARVERVEAAQAQVNQALKEDLHEIQVDIRSLYKSNQTGTRSARLEAPLPVRDGGP
jgi:hypothetical protein